MKKLKIFLLAFLTSCSQIKQPIDGSMEIPSQRIYHKNLQGTWEIDFQKTQKIGKDEKIDIVFGSSVYHLGSEMKFYFLSNTHGIFQFWVGCDGGAGHFEIQNDHSIQAYYVTWNDPQLQTVKMLIEKDKTLIMKGYSQDIPFIYWKIKK